MHLTKDLVSEVVTGLMTGEFTQYADEPAKGDEDFQDWVDEITDLKDEHGPDMIMALARFAEDWLHTPIRSHEVDDFAQEHFKGSGHSKGEVLKAFAEGDEFDLGNLWDVLNKSGGVDYFDWNDFADGGSSLVNGLAFVEEPATGTADTVYLFEEN